MPNVYNQTPQIQAAIVAALVAEMNTTGTNPTGRLQTVQAVGKSWLNEFLPPLPPLYPYIGVDIKTERENFEATNFVRKVQTVWQISVQTKATTTLEDAKAQLFTVLDDGNGNGLKAILRDPAHFSLGQLINQCEIIQTDYQDDLQKDATGSVTAYYAGATVYYKTTMLIQNTGPAV